MCNPDLSNAHWSNYGAYIFKKMSAANLAAIDFLQHKSISVPVQGIWDGVSLSKC